MLLTLLFVPSYVIGRDLWPNNYLDFFSVDMRPVQVTLHRDRILKTDRGVVFEVPRAWITFAGGYDPLKLDQVPDRIDTQALGLALANPDGTALSIRAQEYVRLNSVSQSEALKRLRPEMYYLDFFKIDPGRSTEEWRQRLPDRMMTERDGMPYDSTRGTWMPPSAEAEFAEASCTGSPNRITFCNYIVRLSPDLMAKMTFLDFRFHGGLTYANTRIRRALSTLCRQPGINCLKQVAEEAQL